VVEDLSRELPQLTTFVTLSPVPGLRRWLDAEGLAPGTAEAQRQMAARYLLTATRPSGRPKDPVARFHLRNGAMLRDIHAGADTSERGMAQSGG